MPDRRLNVTLIAFLANSHETGSRNVWEWDGWSDITGSYDNPFTAQQREHVLTSKRVPSGFQDASEYHLVYSGFVSLMGKSHLEVEKALTTTSSPSFKALQTWSKRMAKKWRLSLQMGKLMEAEKRDPFHKMRENGPATTVRILLTPPLSLQYLTAFSQWLTWTSGQIRCHLHTMAIGYLGIQCLQNPTGDLVHEFALEFITDLTKVTWSAYTKIFERNKKAVAKDEVTLESGYKG